MLEIRFNRNIVECKLNLAGNLSFLRHCFNRNIVECKFMSAILEASEACKVLIETLWNVNVEKIEIIRANTWSFNRNIVECK